MRGRRLRVPPETRPTTDRVRAAIFDALQAPPPDRVLDCFAGSGGLGLEALSRGAGYARFVEIKPRAARVITANLRELGIEDCADVVTADALATDLGTAGPYELVLADLLTRWTCGRSSLRASTGPECWPGMPAW